MRYRCVEAQCPASLALLPALLAVAALVVDRCEARPWGDNQAIPTLTRALEASKPTQREPKPTSFDVLQTVVERRLRKRVDYPGNVCGFVGGDVATPAICSANSVCLWDTGHGAVGCSATSGGSLAFYTTCVDHNNNDDSGLQDSQWVFTCKGNDECYRNEYEPVNGQGFTQWGCGFSSWATTVLTQPSGVVGQVARVQLTLIDMPAIRDDPSASGLPISTGESSSELPSSTSDSTTSATDSASPIPSGSTGTSSTSSSETSSEASSTASTTGTDSSSSNTITTITITTNSTSQSSTRSTTKIPSSTVAPPPSNARPKNPVPSADTSPDVGSIAGGVIGGVAGLAVIAALLFAFRKKRNDETTAIIIEATRTSPGPRDMGMIYEQPKELDATPPMRSELPANSSGRSRRHFNGVAELPGSPVPIPIPSPPPPPSPAAAISAAWPQPARGGYGHSHFSR
ncbi:hypothetical protein DRE_04594 [Drechslerella stenobrocha 248]|uniref:Uncharacterized protein n=1 Tax=Drechslerella stenobrocha 248 TaxID=1043628 RepID=W7HPY4_9PEZI|nr:hypothetical protein DRE_04594 [Drechslerella stenobrocha 248]